MRNLGRGLVFLAVFAVGCGAGPLELHVPTLTPNPAREAVTPIDFEPIGASPNPDVILVPGGVEPPGPAAVLASGIRSELQARAFHGGEAGGYVVKSRLDRFALRRDSDKGYGYAVLYVDLSCDIKRKADAAPVWRGELRGRSAALGARQFFSDANVMHQILADRLMSDVTRELASDLAVRVLELEGKPSARVFADQDAEGQLAGIDDGPAGTAALSQNPEAAAKFVDVAHDSVNDRVARAAAWNAIAMASAPDQPWIGGIDTGIDKDTFIRFFQYKALARHATVPTLRELKTARGKEENDLLKEFLHDLETTGGLGLTGFSRRRGNLGL
ncbi:hypothetical protein LVJ94_30935 [Pendulispora rubella]|uniref:Lipoprotein n=1 Tax=Pendulispora rubella TaxID=2741070 RepID=A0ABZ2KUR6_9BACT